MQSNDPVLAFAGFLEQLSRQGFTIGVDRYLRLQELLNQIGGRCAPADLKTLLCPVFAVNKAQQKLFHEAFDSYFHLFQSPAKKQDPGGAAIDWYPTVLGGYQPMAVREWPYFLGGALVVVLILVVGLFILPKGPEEETLAQTPAARAAPQNPSPAKPNPPPVENAAPKPAAFPRSPCSESSSVFYQRGGIAVRLTLTLAPLVFFAFYEWYRFDRRRLALRKQRGKKPPYVWPLRVRVPALRPFDSEQFYSAARLMRRRQVDEFHRLDVDASVAATVAALGYPSFTYKSASKMPEYLVLIDRASFRDHQAELFNLLGKTLEEEGVFVVRYFYDGDPRLCRSETGEAFHLSDLQKRYSRHRLIIFGVGEKLIDPITGKLESWVSAFSDWQERAVLTPETPSRWGVQEITLAGHFIVAPATLDGLASLADQLESSALTDLRSWRRHGSGPKPDELEAPHSVDSLKSYLSEDAFQWLCACAVYPELYWDLTLYLGSLECMKHGLITEANLQRLVRLPWFRSGVMPDDLRWSLIRELDREKEKSIRLAIIDLLEQNPPPRESFAGETYELNLVVQRWLYRRSRKARREMLQVAKSLPFSKASRDYTLLRFLESSRNSPLDFILPGRLRKLFYRNGISAFGVKTSVRALVTLATMSIAWFALAAPRSGINSIAILPFLNQTGDPRMEAIGDELAEGVINRLFRLPELRVISYRSVARYQGQQIDPVIIGRELGVSAVLIGRISKRDDVITLNAELIDGCDKTRIWGQQETLKFSDLTNAPYWLAKSISDKLGLKLSERQRMDLDAEELYQTGRRYWNQRTTDSLNKATDYFEKAIALKPEYALAHAGLADCYNMLATYGAKPPAEAFSTAKAAARKALDIDDSLAEAHISLAYALFRGDWKWADSEREFRQALAMNPRSAQGHQWYASLLVAEGRADEAIAHTKSAQELDSTSLIIRSHFGFVYFFAHRYDDSIMTCQKVLELDPTFFAVRRYLGQAYAQKGKYEQAIAEFQKAVAGSGGSPLIRAELAHTLAIGGKKDEAQKILAELKQLATERYISPYHIAMIYAGLGNKDEAFNWLEKAYQERADHMVFLKVDPRFDPLRSDARMASLLERLGLK
jgi:TolB-like protein/Tfp pilus assembly protein PilF